MMIVLNLNGILLLGFAIYNTDMMLICLFDSLCTRQQFFSYVGTGIPGLKY